MEHVTERVGARGLLRRVLDGGRWTSWDVPPRAAGPEPG